MPANEADRPTLPPFESDPEYIIDNIMPAHEIHLLGGPSGAGKTTLVYQMLYEMKIGSPVFGYASHPVPTCYIGCDRSLASGQRTLSRIGVNLHLPTISLINDGVLFKIDAVVAAALRKVPDCRLIIIDAIGSLVDDGKLSDYRKVQSLLCDATRECQYKHLTMLGLGHTAKVREGEQFKNPRERFLGSVAWGGFSDTMFCIEPTNPEDPRDPGRKVLVLPRNSASLAFDYAFDATGRLVQTQELDTELTLDVNLLKVASGAELTTATIFAWAGEGAAKRSVERWIAEAIQQGKLERVRRGIYKRPSVN